MLGVIFLALLVVLFILVITRYSLRRLLPQPVLKCPVCDMSLYRTRRNDIDRLLNLLVPVHRYQCRNLKCDWTGLRIQVNQTRRRR